MSSDERITVFGNKWSQIKWNIVGISEPNVIKSGYKNKELEEQPLTETTNVPPITATPITTNSPRPTHPMDNPEWLPPNGPTAEKSKSHWLTIGQNILEKQLQKNILNQNIAKNVIIFIGDGLSIPTQAATRIYMGDENIELSFERFPYTGLAKTYCVNYQVSDSACTASAILSGVKSNYGTLGVSAAVPLGNCTAQELDEENHTETIFKLAQDIGKSTGIVTTTRLTHATPAAAYARVADREWENDSVAPKGCVDVAYQMVYGDIGKKIKVFLGGGARELTPITNRDSHGRAGYRTDNRNLIEEWLIERQKNGNAVYVNDREQLLNLNTSDVDYLLGVFEHSHMNYYLNADHTIEPTLLEMTIKALEILKKNDNGYILLIEGGRIDHAHHATLAHLALDETVQFHKTVEYVQSIINEDDTLIIVTADHSHTLSIGGYPIRGNNIFATGDFSRDDSMPFFTLNYANGMGNFQHTYHDNDNDNNIDDDDDVDDEYKNNRGRKNPLDMNYMDTDFTFPATVPLEDETHGGDDVAVFAIGPWAHIFTGCYEQNFVGHGIMYAACLGDNLGEFCKSKGYLYQFDNMLILFNILIVLFLSV